jgi:hypothetical protein
MYIDATAIHYGDVVYLEMSVRAHFFVKVFNVF